MRRIVNIDIFVRHRYRIFRVNINFFDISSCRIFVLEVRFNSMRQILAKYRIDIDITIFGHHRIEVEKVISDHH